MNLVNKIKDKRDECKFEKLKKKISEIKQEMSEFRCLRENSRTGEILNVTDRLINPVIKHESEELVKKKTVCDKGGEYPCHIDLEDIWAERIKKSSCNKHKRSLKEYRLREGNEQEWIEKIKGLMERQQKPLEQQLTDLMSLVRYHRDIKNALKTKRMAIRQKKNEETMNEFLNRLSEIYGQNKKLRKRINRKIRCNKCKKRGHLRKNCPK